MIDNYIREITEELTNMHSKARCTVFCNVDELQLFDMIYNQKMMTFHKGEREYND